MWHIMYNEYLYFLQAVGYVLYWNLPSIITTIHSFAVVSWYNNINIFTLTVLFTIKHYHNESISLDHNWFYVQWCKVDDGILIGK
jgi:hypothetical protein